MDSLRPPEISVIMPVYNAATFLRESIESVLGQTFRDFEFLILNDGSTDISLEIIKSFKDDRIIIFSSTHNKGLVYQLNQGLRMARGKYIARMDADDVCQPERFEKQFNFLENNPDIGICGSSIQVFGDGSARHITYPESDRDLRFFLALNSCFAHPSVMIRKDSIMNKSLHYDLNEYPAEDYGLWVRLLRHTKGANINENLLKYRVHESSISRSKIALQMFAAQKVRENFLNEYYGHLFSKHQIEVVADALGLKKLEVTDLELDLIENFFLYLIKQFDSNANEAFKLMKEQLIGQFTSSCVHYSRSGFCVFLAAWNSNFYDSKKYCLLRLFLKILWLQLGLVKNGSVR